MQIMEVPLKTFSGIFLLALLTPALNSQQTQAPEANTADLQPTPAVHNRDGGVSEVLESIYIPPLVNAPFTAIVHTEWTRPIGDGGTWTIVNQRRVARDGGPHLRRTLAARAQKWQRQITKQRDSDCRSECPYSL